MQTIEKMTYTFIGTFLAIGVFLSYFSEDYFRNYYVVEDGVIEWLSVFTLLLITWICIKRLIILHRKRSAIFLLMTALLGLFCLFGAGEEISWGQRLFNLESPEWFKHNNAQQEINLHNLVVKDKKINKIIFAKGIAIIVAIYLLVITPLYRRKEKFKHFIDSLAIPMPHNHHIIAYIVALVIIELIVDSSKRGELTEFAGPLIFAMSLLFPTNHYIFDPEIDLMKKKKQPHL